MNDDIKTTLQNWGLLKTKRDIDIYNKIK